MMCHPVDLAENQDLGPQGLTLKQVKTSRVRLARQKKHIPTSNIGCPKQCFAITVTLVVSKESLKLTGTLSNYLILHERPITVSTLRSTNMGLG